MSGSGYSGTPLVRKLGIRPGDRVAALRAPADFEALLGDLPDGVVISSQARGRCDVVVLFARRAQDVRRALPRLRERIFPDGALWVAWPKRASGVESDLTEDVVRAAALGERLVDNKVCAIDATWSGLRLVVRVADRGR